MRRWIGLVLVLTAVALPARTVAQVDVQGATSLSIAGSGIVGGDFQNLTNILGLNKFIAGGLELGGFLIATISSSSTSSETDVSGFFFGKLRYNFIGQSMTVPFLEVATGTQLDEPSVGERPTLVQGGGGVKWFLKEGSPSMSPEPCRASTSTDHLSPRMASS